jgi:phage terminase large subunit
MWKTFDKIHNGIDWGFAMDPFRFVRMHYDAKKLDLYIFKEFSTVATRNQIVFDILYKEKKLIGMDELVTADSAEPKSIADFKAYGAYIRGAVKGPDSVRYGIKWLQGLNHIYIDRRMCPKTYKEFTHYEYLQDKDGNFISDYPDEENHSIDATRYAMEKFYSRRGN